jgi:hypothetical protein
MVDQEFLARVMADADAQVNGLLPALLPQSATPHAVPHTAPYKTGMPYPTAMPHRAAMSRLLGLLAVFTASESTYYQRPELIGPMIGCLERLEHLQGPTGLFDGENLSSPPDSAFTINDACLAVDLIRSATQVSATESSDGNTSGGNAHDANSSGGMLQGGRILPEIETRLRQIIAMITPALVEGGVHTPNHRWELCAALAQIHRLDPRPEIDRRIDEWLAEGIDQLPDGMYSERSPLYATAVTNPSLLAIADSSDRPELLGHVRRNLEAFLPWFNPDGTVESLFSRRQDQWMRFQGSVFLLLYRRFAVQDRRSDFAAAAAWLAGFPIQEPAKVLAQLRITPLLAAPLPGAPLPPEVSDSTMPAVLRPPRAALDSCGLFRFREGDTTVTVYGGGDHSPSGVASGLSNNPTFLRFQHGDSVLSDVRLSRSFFDLGPFRSVETSLEGETVKLHEEVAASFYLPLPPDKRRADGIYPQTHEGRFSSAMDFPSRPTVHHHLATSIGAGFAGRQTDLEISFEGADTSFALELTFRPGGELEGVEEVGEGAYQLVGRMGRYTVGADSIEFGPGSPLDPDAPADYNPGEEYKYLRGTNATEGTKVFITGRTRGTRRLTLRGASARAGAAGTAP